jgi:hyperosmotically inducible protein
VMRSIAIVLACGLLVAAAGVGSGEARTIGQVIDDVAIVASVKAKLTAEQLSNLVRIDVTSNDGVVTLSGAVDTPERRDRIVQLATWVKGVKRVVDNIQVPGEAAAPVGVEERGASVPAGWRMGTVRSVDRAAGQLVLTDSTVVRLTPATVVQRGSERLTLDDLRPGWEIVVRVPPAPAVEASQIDVVWAPTAHTR